MDEQDWTRVVAAATRAPSIHNTQPWRFVGTADRLQVFLDRDRALPVLDPTARQQIISCGVAVEFALVALRALGHDARVDLELDGSAGDLLATLRVTGERDATESDRAMAAAIEHRHTVRAPFASRAVPAGFVERLQSEAGGYRTWVKPITASEEEVATVFLIARAEEMEQGDPAYLEELRRWVRTDPGAADGVPVEAVPVEDPHGRPSNWLIRDFVVGRREPQSVFQPEGDAATPPPEVERPAVLLLGTDSDDRGAWLQAGRALGRLLLLITAEGFAASPLTQALDWPATRARLRTRLSLVGYPQMLMRLGYPGGEAVVVASGRRPVEQVLTFQPA